MKTRQSFRWVLPIVAAGFLAACGEEPENAQDTVLPDRPDEKLIEGTEQPGQVSSDPTPQAGTSGAIPGHTPLESEEAEGETQPTDSN